MQGDAGGAEGKDGALRDVDEGEMGTRWGRGGLHERNMMVSSEL